MADGSVNFPPFRSFSDFLLNSAQFKFPALHDQDRWSNRVVNNLLYYQTNYFVALIIIILLIGVTFPAEFLNGLVGSLCAVVAITIGFSQTETMKKVRRDKLWLLLGCLAFLAYMVYTSVRSIAIFAFPFAISVLLIYVHASMRTRSIKNRISNKMEQMGIRKTPMGLLMELTGYEIQLRMLDVVDDAIK